MINNEISFFCVKGQKSMSSLSEFLGDNIKRVIDYWLKLLMKVEFCIWSCRGLNSYFNLIFFLIG